MPVTESDIERIETIARLLDDENITIDCIDVTAPNMADTEATIEARWG